MFDLQRDLEKNPKLEQLFVYQEIVELIDISIEIKSDPDVLNRKIQDLTNTDYLVGVSFQYLCI